MEGKTINGYTLKKRLGVGGMAEVWYAENSLGKCAAVKLLLPKFCNDETVVARFQNEAKVMVQLDHPNIRQVYDFGYIDQRPCILMEYLEGDDLKALMKSGKRFTNDELIRWWNQIADALTYTHDKDIVHRDIKPSNIFLDKKGNIKLLDFGIAKIKESISMTQTGTMMGTLLYMSPEQVTDSKHIGPKSDIYSLAVTFVHLLSGKAPYDTTTSNDYEIRKGIVEIPLDLSKVPAEWQGFLKPYLEKEAEKRPELKHYEPTELPKEEDTQVFDVTDEETVIQETEKPTEKPVETVKKTEEKYKKDKEEKIEKKEKKDEEDKPKKKKSKFWLGLLIGIVAFIVLALVLGEDKDTKTFKSCYTVNDYRAYLSLYDTKAKHYSEAKRFVDNYIADSIKDAKQKEQEAYNKCTTIATCDNYLKAYPKGQYVNEVTKIKNEIIDFNNCDNIAACDNYIYNYPNGRHVNEVKDKRENIAYKGCNTYLACDGYLKSYPNGQHANEIKTLKKNLSGKSNDALFSVSSSKKVVFSKGNLQYQASTGTWRFAEHQWDIIGDYNRNISSTYSGWIDLFGWGTSGYNGKYPYMTTTTYTDYGNGSKSISGTKYDWGIYNTISNGSNRRWRTMNIDEWTHLLYNRTTNSGIRFVKACVNGVNGLILLPDNWDTSVFRLNKKNDRDAVYSSNTISLNDWINTFETHGAIFLPVGGERYQTTIKYSGSSGIYNSTSCPNENVSWGVFFSSNFLMIDLCWRHEGLSVRLVSDI